MAFVFLVLRRATMKHIIFHAFTLTIANLIGFVDLLQSTFINLFTDYANFFITFIYGYSTMSLGLLLTKETKKNYWKHIALTGTVAYMALYTYWALYPGILVLAIAAYLAWKKHKRLSDIVENNS